MRLEVTTGTPQMYAAAAAGPAIEANDSSAINKYVEFCETALQKAYAEAADVFSLQSIAPLEKQSDNFSVIGDILRALLTFMDTHNHPETVRIICDNEETARLYKIIYNFWFAENKAERLDDNSWD
ncbi:MAG: hypothetical protein E7221_07360 [Clostridiales bacterium]|nr:hypothetical protein [Clostridiales bacterium]